ncbi:carboxypeptidase B-like [Leptidea sinapis]|uniref:carboxypeptidase B-like n=1 Tax=Leptidea sinapis TaxID=189913 RepID=UPI0021251243|nr:carboxypeptidase B-like [Leptidea sinapis]
MISYYISLNFILFVSAQNELYKGYKVYNIKFNSEQQQNTFKTLNNGVIDFWRAPCFKHGVVGQAMVPPTHVDWWEDILQDLGVEREIWVEDVYGYLANSNIIKLSEDTFDFNGYYRYEKILEYMQKLELEHQNSPNFNVELINGGSTDEGRPLVYIKLSRTSSAPKPVVIIEGGINPREWITVPAALNVVDKLIEQERFLDNFDWIIAPVVNPDGYEYTHTNLRFWSKNRSIRSNLGAICPGVNINRNFDIDWGVSSASSSPCSHIYAGIEPFSEPESRFLKSILEEYKETLTLYFSLQNTGGFLAYPWHYEKAASGMFRQHYLLGLDMIKAMGDNYTQDVGSIAYGDRISGTSSDYMAINEVLYAFNIDAAPRGSEGVEVAVEDIGIFIDKVWQAIRIAANNFIP